MQVTKHFSHEVYASVMNSLRAYLTKEQQAVRLFKTWDFDNSGTLDTIELRRILEHFKTHSKQSEADFKTLSRRRAADTDAEEGQARPEFSHDKRDEDYAGWTNNVVASLDYLAADKQLDLAGFKAWLVQVAGHLSPETFDKAMNELLEIVSKRVSTKELFKMWDKDGSGQLDFEEVGSILKWFSDNVPGIVVNFGQLWSTLPMSNSGTISLEQFGAWIMKVTAKMSVQQYAVVTERLKERLREKGLADPDRSDTTKTRQHV
jgi:Ca2+-binding EF-hand superfamily protein